MAITATISQKELERQANLSFEAKSFTVFLATNSGSLTAQSTYSAWVAVAPSGGGYAAVTGTIGTGSYNGTTNRYELPTITATFTATGAGFSYDTVCLRIGTETYLHSIVVESPSITLLAGQSKTYTLLLAQDD